MGQGWMVWGRAAMGLFFRILKHSGAVLLLAEMFDSMRNNRFAHMTKVDLGLEL